METTQICTTIEQSDRLLELGLNDDTADMFHPAQHIGKDIVRYSDPQMLVHNDHFEIFVDDQPAWSLHRLMKIGNITNIAFLEIDSIYEVCIETIASKIRFKHINPEYLKEK